ncbi:type IV secretory system conjugative DNA transfer family protein [Paracoccus sp. (in: a-proteobacteria)]|uniref:type IV secretory system conjugative DNA transfer family protein n=1 Tax=Paracoccus sp. TaxID=267 RepID=UPI00321F8955
MPELDNLRPYGDEHFAYPDDLKAGGWYDKGGVFIGYDVATNRPLYFNGEGHLLTVAPQGTGKTSSLIIPNLLQYDRGSVVVTDPKGEITAVTMRARRDHLKNRIVVLNPWREEIAQEGEASAGRDFGDCSFNPLRSLHPGNPALYDDAGNLLSIIMPDRPQDSETSRFFTSTARNVLIGAALYLAVTRGFVTLPDLYTYARTGDAAAWLKEAEKWEACEGFDLSGFAAEIRSNAAGGNQWAGIVGTMTKATNIYSPAGALGKHLARDEFDPADLKREKVTVYIVIPANRRQQNEPWLALVMSCMAQAAGDPSRVAPVLLVAEEFANLGHMSMMAGAMAEFRGAGLKVHLVLQNEKQLRNTYGAQADELLALCNVRTYFGVSDLELAKKLSEELGTFTLPEYAPPVRKLFGSDPVGQLLQRHQKVLKSPQEIMNLPTSVQLVFSTGSTPPIMSVLVGYYRTGLRKLADPNPMVKAAPAPLSALQKQVVVAGKRAATGLGQTLWLKWWYWKNRNRPKESRWLDKEHQENDLLRLKNRLLRGQIAYERHLGQYLRKGWLLLKLVVLGLAYPFLWLAAKAPLLKWPLILGALAFGLWVNWQLTGFILLALFVISRTGPTRGDRYHIRQEDRR